MNTDNISESAIAVNDSKAQVLLALEQLLEQCDEDDMPELVNQVKTKLARRCYTLNAYQCRLLDLPPELLARIGKFVLESQHGSPTKHWFTRGIFPLLQTCSQLRTQLEPLRSTRAICYIVTDRPWSSVMQAVKEWRRGGYHKGPTMIAIHITARRDKPSTAAALAGALECAIYGRLLETPAVYIRLRVTFPRTSRNRYRKFYVSHRRAEHMLVTSSHFSLLDDPSSRLSHEEAIEIWEHARTKAGDEAP
jgi:hypothetical protein